MSGKLQLSYEGLRKEAGTINGYKEEFNVLLSKIMKTNNNLSQVWEDAAARDFIEKVNLMKPTFEKFSEALDGLQRHMNEVSTKYQELQTAIISSQKF